MRHTSWRDRTERLTAELLRMDEPAATELAIKLAACGREWSGRYTCRQPCCGWCRRRYQGQQARSLIAECEGLDNADLAFVSIVHGGTDSLDDLDALVAGISRGARNRIDTLRRLDLDRWGGVAMRMWVEIDAVAGDQVPLLGSERRALLPQIAPLAIDETRPTWIVTAHGLLVPGSASRAEVSQALSEQWPIAGQVDVRPLDETKTAEENIADIVGYSTKFATETQFGAIKEPWPWPWQAEIFAKMAEKRNAYEYCRFGLGPAAVLESSQDCSCSSGSLLEPMPVVHSSITIPVSYITGDHFR